jgi:hypothetical protein
METKEKKTQKQPNVMHYWLVEITLTSGEILEFYVKALTLSDAYEKADTYAVLAENEALKNYLKKFRLMP